MESCYNTHQAKLNSTLDSKKSNNLKRNGICEMITQIRRFFS